MNVSSVTRHVSNAVQKRTKLVMNVDLDTTCRMVLTPAWTCVLQDILTGILQITNALVQHLEKCLRSSLASGSQTSRQ